LASVKTPSASKGREKKGCPPKHLSMHSARVELEIAPSRGRIVTFRIGTIESEDNERFVPHVLRLEKDGQFGVLVGDRIGGVGRKVGVWGGGEDDRRLGLLSDRG
jgi:hypothetical protein